MSKPQADVVEIKPPQAFTASVFGDDTPIADGLVSAINELGKALDMPVWLLIQNMPMSNPWSGIDHGVFNGFLEQINDLPKGKHVAVVIDSPGGDARFSYKLARLLRFRCKGYTAVIPSYAKSAATLLALGADRIILGPCGELGPLDMQVEDREREEAGSALNHVQSLERLSAFALRTIDQTMLLMLGRTGKKVSNVLPQAMSFACSIVRPLMENVDVVRYTEMSRILRVGEAYAERLLRRKYGSEASDIAAKLVSDYPEHGFVIEHTEAKAIGLKVEYPDDKLQPIIEKFMPFVNNTTVIGQLRPQSE